MEIHQKAHIIVLKKYKLNKIIMTHLLEISHPAFSVLKSECNNYHDNLFLEVRFTRIRSPTLNEACSIPVEYILLLKK